MQVTLARHKHSRASSRYFSHLLAFEPEMRAILDAIVDPMLLVYVPEITNGLLDRVGVLELCRVKHWQCAGRNLRAGSAASAVVESGMRFSSDAVTT